MRALISGATPDTEYIRDNGHLRGEQIGGDFDLSMRVRGFCAAQCDQPEAMVRVDERRRLKTGIKFFDGRPRFSTVITLDRVRPRHPP
jgi:hypothetical protein